MAADKTIVLGIETSCDETAVAIVSRGDDARGKILANLVRSQLKEHAPFGGVVPEIAARSHIQYLARMTRQALGYSGLAMTQVAAVAATSGPGLLGGLLVGMSLAKGLALSAGKPFLAINHLEAHALTPRLIEHCEFPYLLLLVSGGHTQFQLVRGVGDYERLGSTIDDALGEAFDKTAKLLGLGYPGGPQVEERAKLGDPTRFGFPRPLRGRDDCNLSFSGLKTAVRTVVQNLEQMSDKDIADVCASFQLAIVDTLLERLTKAFNMFELRCTAKYDAVLVVAGGVAANMQIRKALHQSATKRNFRLIVPPFDLCTDNAAMVAWAGAERLAIGRTNGLDFAPRPRWPLDVNAAPLYGAGRLGAKA